MLEVLQKNIENWVAEPCWEYVGNAFGMYKNISDLGWKYTKKIIKVKYLL